MDLPLWYQAGVLHDTLAGLKNQANSTDHLERTYNQSLNGVKAAANTPLIASGFVMRLIIIEK